MPRQIWKAKWHCFENISSREYGKGNFRSWSNRGDLIHSVLCWIWFSCAVILFWILECFEACKENSESFTILRLMMEDSAIILGIHILKRYHFKVPPHYSYQIPFHFQSIKLEHIVHFQILTHKKNIWVCTDPWNSETTQLFLILHSQHRWDSRNLLAWTWLGFFHSCSNLAPLTEFSLKKFGGT